jgi:hypothetical protein
MAARADHARLQALAERGWLAEEAKANRAARRGIILAIRRSVGDALIWTGARLQGAPRMTNAGRPISAASADGAVS